MKNLFAAIGFIALVGSAEAQTVNQFSTMSTNPNYSGDIVVTPTATFTRPANTTAYVIGYLVGNSTTAGSVVPMSWTVARVSAGNLYIRRAWMLSTGKSITNASFVLHLYTASPTIANGDGAAWSTTVAKLVCDIPITLSDIGSDDAIGWGAPGAGSECNIVAGAGTQLVYGLLSAAAAYTPISGEVIVVGIEAHEN